MPDILRRTGPGGCGLYSGRAAGDFCDRPACQVTDFGSGRRHVARYTQADHGATGDRRLHSPVFHRNAPPLIAVLSQYLLGRTGVVLEIGAGTGQHAAAFALAFPTLTWIASDPYEEHCASAAAWQAELGIAGPAPLALDAAGDWAGTDAIRAVGPLAAIYAGNVAHITPWAVTEGLLDGAGRTLDRGGRLFLYGPFRDGQNFFGEGNRRFDADLRADNPEWGLRDLAHVETVARGHGLAAEARHAMPANNHLLVFTAA